MARTFTGSSAVYAEYAGAVVTALPLTMSAWVYPTSISANNCVVAIEYTSAATFWSASLNTSGNVVATSSVNASTAVATTTTALSINTWNHICCVFTSTTSRAAYLNGGGVGTNATSSSPTGLSRTTIGLQHCNTSLYPFTGRIAEAAIWNVALTAGEIAALANGVRTNHMRPSALQGYWPLWGIHSAEIDLASVPHLMTLNGTPAASTHSPIRPFTLLGGPTPLIQVAAAGGPFPWFTPIFNDRNFAN